jgi:hypothetical protein
VESLQVVLLLPVNNDLTNTANAPTISSLPGFYVPEQILPDPCSLHGVGLLHQDPALSTTTCVPPGIQDPSVDISTAQPPASRNVVASPSVLVLGPAPAAPAPPPGSRGSSSGLVPGLLRQHGPCTRIFPRIHNGPCSRHVCTNIYSGIRTSVWSECIYIDSAARIFCGSF